MSRSFKDAMSEKLDEFRKTHRDREITVWKLFLSIIDGKDNLYILTLKADMPILERLAKGISIGEIAGQLGIRTSDVSDVAKLWGFTPVSLTLDFSPEYVYKVGMSAEIFLTEINEILAIPITLDTAKKVVYNIEHLEDLKLFLEDVDD